MLITQTVHKTRHNHGNYSFWAICSIYTVLMFHFEYYLRFDTYAASALGASLTAPAPSCRIAVGPPDRRPQVRKPHDLILKKVLHFWITLSSLLFLIHIFIRLEQVCVCALHEGCVMWRRVWAGGIRVLCATGENFYTQKRQNQNWTRAKIFCNIFFFERGMEEIRDHGVNRPTISDVSLKLLRFFLHSILFIPENTYPIWT